MARKGKYFRIDEHAAEAFDAWCDARRWVNQGALFEALLRYAMAASPETLVALLEGHPNTPTNDVATPSATNNAVPAERRKTNPKRRPAKGRG